MKIIVSHTHSGFSETKSCDFSLQTWRHVHIAEGKSSPCIFWVCNFRKKRTNCCWHSSTSKRLLRILQHLWLQECFSLFISHFVLLSPKPGFFLIRQPLYFHITWSKCLYFYPEEQRTTQHPFMMRYYAGALWKSVWLLWGAVGNPQVVHSSPFTFLAVAGVASVVACMCMDEWVP